VDLKDYLHHFTNALHENWEAALADLSDEQFHHQPSANTNHIAFTAWHWVRTEDNIVQFVLQRKPTVWLEMGLNEKWSLPKNEQGTGMAPDQAYAMHIPSPAEFLDYAKAVWARTTPWIDQVTQDELARITKVMPFGEIPVLQIFGQTIIAHGNQHLGEVWLIREMQGLKGIGM
jgi:hypothetical protein